MVGESVPGGLVQEEIKEQSKDRLSLEHCGGNTNHDREPRQPSESRAVALHGLLLKQRQQTPVCRSQLPGGALERESLKMLTHFSLSIWGARVLPRMQPEASFFPRIMTVAAGMQVGKIL